MDDYTNSKIYRIDVIGCEKVYIGSCYTSLDIRFSKHKCDTSNKCSSKELFEIGEPVITLIENYSCETKIELCMREQYYMDLFVNDGYTLVNKQRAYTSPEMKQEYRKEYREIHKEQKKEYYKTNKESIKQQKKEYRDNNRDAINQQKKAYRESHKEELKEYFKKKFVCECGGKYTNGSKSTHRKSKKHQTFISNIS